MDDAWTRERAVRVEDERRRSSILFFNLVLPHHELPYGFTPVTSTHPLCFARIMGLARLHFRSLGLDLGRDDLHMYCTVNPGWFTDE
jgi:hypothetical protein